MGRGNRVIRAQSKARVAHYARRIAFIENEPLQPARSAIFHPF